MRILRVECSTPSAPPKRLALNHDECSVDASQTLIVRVVTDDGPVGIGLTQVIGPGVGAVRAMLDELAPLFIGDDPLSHEKLWAKVQQSTRSIGFRGIVARAYAAIDIALWDIKGKVAGLPLWKLLGGAKATVPAFLTSRDASKAGQQAARLGVMGVLLELGGCDPEADADAVQTLREIVGEDTWLSVTAGGKYDLATALALGHVFEEEVGVDWLEDPLPAWDEAGYRRLAQRLEQTIAAGTVVENEADADRWLRSESVRVLRPDVLRLGGVTPWLRVAALAELYPITLCPYRLPEVGVHLACGLQAVQVIEWTPTTTWTSGPTLEKGRAIPPTGPGLGIEIPE